MAKKLLLAVAFIAAGFMASHVMLEGQDGIKDPEAGDVRNEMVRPIRGRGRSEIESEIRNLYFRLEAETRADNQMRN